MHALDFPHRLHQAKTQVAAIAQHQEACDQFSKVYFNMPESLLGEPRPCSECLGASAFCMEGFALHADVVNLCVDSGMAQSLNDSSCGNVLFLRPLQPTLGFLAQAARIDAAACGPFW